MANIKSQKKRIRTNEAARMRNKAVKSELKTLTKHVQSAVAEGDAEKAVNAYNKLKGDGVQLIYGCTTTTPCVAVAAETFNDRYFQLTPSASSTDVTSGRDNVFQVCFTDPNQGLTAANYIKENGLGTKVAVIYNNGDAYSTGIYNAFQSEADAIGLEVVSVTTFPDDTNADFTVQLGEAQSAGADLVFMPIYYQPASIILAQAKAMGYAPTFFGVDGMDGILGVEGFDTSLAEGLLLMTPFSADDEKNADFVNAYKDKYGDTPEVAEKLSKAMLKITVDGLTGKLTWNDKGQVQKEPTAYVITDGKYVQA